MNTKKTEAEFEQLRQQISALQQERERLYQAVNVYENSTFWKITKPFRFICDKLHRCVYYAKKGKEFYHAFGFKRTLWRIVHHKDVKAERARYQMEIQKQFQENEIWDELSRWIDNTPHEFIDIFGVPMGWNTPLFQRFQHLSLQAGNAGGISFYGAHPAVDKDILTYKFVSPSLCIVNLEDPAVYNKLFEILDQKDELKYIRIQSIDLATTIDQIESFLQRGYNVVYEYIDEITPQITGNVPEQIYARHEYILRNTDITVVATSDKLFEQVKPYRSENMEMINNGVDYDFWNVQKDQVECPEDMKPVLAAGKIIVAYHGALAKWVDYDLLKSIAKDGRYSLVLIGHEHDDNLKKSKLLACENVYYLGAKDYHSLNQYAAFYDIGILPFIINDITLSVSPVKIFEYMAAGKPVVTYALPECLKYESCLCAYTKDEFMQKLEDATTLREDSEYLKKLQKDALDNTWISITRRTVELVKQQYIKSHGIYTETQLLNESTSEAYRNSYIETILRSPKLVDEKKYVPLTQKPYQRKEGDCKVIAYYLTQFHPDKHNEEWWGKGVTEWNNVTRAVPQFVGHYQPRYPGELGYYDLRIVENMQRQIELAKMYGVYGFSFYYYWFDGERLLEKPLEMFLQKPDELDFPFSLCWANENWTRRFDGTNSAVLMEQPNSLASYKAVIKDMIRFFKDRRYIEVNGKKLLTIYRPSLMPNPSQVLEFWREYVRAQGYGELYIIAVKENMVEKDWLAEGFDAVSEFHPGTLYTNCKNITSQLNYMRNDFCGEVFSYEDIVRKQKYFKYNYPKLYRAVMPMWDNTARRDNKGMIFHGATPALYKQWLKDVINEEKQRDDLDDCMVFINAWNEWGEGAYLEPDKLYGYAYLEATKEAVEET